MEASVDWGNKKQYISLFWWKIMTFQSISLELSLAQWRLMYVSIISLVSDHHHAGYHWQMLESIIRSQDPVSILTIRQLIIHANFETVKTEGNIRQML